MWLLNAWTIKCFWKSLVISDSWPWLASLWTPFTTNTTPWCVWGCAQTAHFGVSLLTIGWFQGVSLLVCLHSIRHQGSSQQVTNLNTTSSEWTWKVTSAIKPLSRLYDGKVPTATVKKPWKILAPGSEALRFKHITSFSLEITKLY